MSLNQLQDRVELGAAFVIFCQSRSVIFFNKNRRRSAILNLVNSFSRFFLSFFNVFVLLQQSAANTNWDSWF